VQASSVHDGCELARAVVDDGLLHPDVVALAKLGAEGNCPQNELRDLHRLHDRNWGQGLQPQYIDLTLKSENRTGDTVVRVPVIAPHEAFHHLWVSGDFERTLLADGRVSLQEYWECAMSQDWCANHPLRDKPDMWPFAVPIVWFTDGAEFSKSSQAEAVIFQWSSAIVEGMTSLSCKFLCSFLVGDTFSEKTNDELVAYFAWSQTIMMSGRFPDKDFYGVDWPTSSWQHSKRGEPLAGPYIGVFSACAHDAKARVATHTSL
jgi:hypothetical protein